MNYSRKEETFNQVCKEILLGHIAKGEAMPSASSLKKLAQEKWEQVYKEERVQDMLCEAIRANAVSASLVGGHLEEARKVAELSLPCEWFSENDAETAINQVKNTLKQYVKAEEVNND